MQVMTSDQLSKLLIIVGIVVFACLIAAMVSRSMRARTYAEICKDAVAQFAATVKNHYADTRGRAGRQQFWQYISIMTAASVTVLLISGIVGWGVSKFTLIDFEVPYQIGLLVRRSCLGILWVVLLSPTIAITARRFHDLNRDGFWATLIIAPVSVFVFLPAVAIVSIAFGLIDTDAVFIFEDRFGLVLVAVSIACLAGLAYFCTRAGGESPNRYGPPIHR